MLNPRWSLELLTFAHALRWSERKVGVAVVYHQVDEAAGDEATELVPAISTKVFRRQLILVRASFELVPASQLPAKAERRIRGDRVPLAITFDDDLESHVGISAPLLSRAGAIATFFLCGADLAGPNGYWWEHLQAAVDSEVLQDVLEAPNMPVSVVRAWTGSRESIHSVAEAILRCSSSERDEIVRRLAAADPGQSRRERLRATA